MTDNSNGNPDLVATGNAIQQVLVGGESSVTPKQRALIISAVGQRRIAKNAAEVVKVALKHLNLTPDERTVVEDGVKSMVERISDFTPEQYGDIEANRIKGWTYDQYKAFHKRL